MRKCENCKVLLDDNDLNEENLCYACYCSKHGLYDHLLERGEG